MFQIKEIKKELKLQGYDMNTLFRELYGITVNEARQVKSEREAIIIDENTPDSERMMKVIEQMIKMELQISLGRMSEKFLKLQQQKRDFEIKS